MRPIIEFLDPKNLGFYEGCSDYTSLVWENKTSSTGNFEIHIPRALPQICHGLIVHICRDVPEPYGIITCVKMYDTKTVIIGSMLSKVFDWRYMQNDGIDVTIAGSSTGHLICNCAKYGCVWNNANDFFGKPAVFEYPHEGVSASIKGDMQTSCLELMTSVAREGNYCFGCTIEQGAIKVFAYPYTERELTINSNTHAEGFCYTSSCDSERNVFGYSLGDSESGYVYKTSSKGGFSGTERRMLNLGRFETAPGSIIREKTALLTPTESVDVKLRLKYPEEFSLGDILTVENPDLGFSKKLSVTAVREVWENKYSCEVTFGIPQETVYTKLLRIYR